MCIRDRSCSFHLLCFWKSKSSIALKTTSPNAFTVTNSAQKSAWMSSDLFKEWFYNNFVLSVEKHFASKKHPWKAILIIDNARTHQSQYTVSHKKWWYCSKVLPGNVTSLINRKIQNVWQQTMDLKPLRYEYFLIFINQLILLFHFKMWFIFLMFHLELETWFIILWLKVNIKKLL